mmetsp:Transcript_24041/g.35776  ORF Transcript_24041/g.35776 Transcript_24041/m.35776 type:complete len:661 (+) Transcript_24041:150-2132(+)|eukprot:CAMPEP_0203663412 /NCGR_PEP_ID=MMETSP0090-20130426/1007_1 /ASSEMBLY_ACC=CAM_ASM_001088 /TAXON_ID=426623 /ORGANISM="Chaetoceros affinis, Strain CCMP159" /LENGTH=660 /DNA_ID=CAMNT_0050526319 /DNA_START=102 /DNA_END=2084 /DNA_ORIENTATION=-
MPNSNPEASEWDELEARSLVFAEIDGPQETLASKRNKMSQSYRWRQVGVLLVLAFCAFMAYVRGDVIALLILDVEEEHEKLTKDILGDLKKRAADARIEVDKLIEEDYGQFKDEVFTKENMMNAFQSPSELSVERLQRRILIKIIEAQLRTSDDTTFNWVIAGHSAAAGHGNLFNQTTAFILEQTARPFFEALGITFYGKNYAMGGTKSAPENALCMSAVYGPDLDILSWDFGMTDGSREPTLYNTWTQRAGVHPTSPTIISFGSAFAGTIHQEVEKAGMSAFQAVFVNEKSGDLLAAKFPDSDDSKVNVTELPRGVKNYRCGGRTETGEPCGDKLIKFNTEGVCEQMRGQVSWHNGHKDHLLRGRVSALFLIENVFEALSKLDETPLAASESESDGEEDKRIAPSISEEYLSYLHSLEAKDKESFKNSEPPKVHHFEDRLTELHDAFLRSNNVCRYAYLPSYTRYEGILTENRQEIKYLGGGRITYQDEGVRSESQPAPKPDSLTEPLLVYNAENDRLVCSDAQIDFKDYFGIRNEDEWVATIIPNDSEEEVFVSDYEKENRKGVVTVCERVFAWGRFPENFVSIENVLNTSDTTITVNDIPATEYQVIGTENGRCHVLGNKDGFTFPASLEHGPGKYEIKFKVPEKGGVLYLSSFIIF